VQGKISFRRGKKGLSAEISDSKQDPDCFSGGMKMGAMECWDDLAEETVVVGVVGWVWVELLVWQGLEAEKIRLKKDQEEERALVVLNEGGDGRELRREPLRFFEGRWSFVVVKMKQPRWRRRMKIEKNLLNNVATFAITLRA
jgi:hypothetical protein